MSVKIYMDQEQIKKIMAIPKEASKRAFLYLMTEIWAGLREEPPIDHGRLRGSWQMEKLNDYWYKLVSGVEYGPWVAYGTGIYGPRGVKITPTTKKALSFMWKGMKITVKSVKGQKPNPFHERALKRGEDRLDEFIRTALRETGG